MALKSVADCPHLLTCGACDLGRLSYEEQLAEKSKRLNTLLSPYITKPISITPAPRSIGYRSRAMFRMHLSRHGMTLGYFKKGTRTLNTVAQCLIADEAVNCFLKEAHTLNLELGDVSVRYRIYAMSIDSKQVDILIHSVEKDDLSDRLLMAAMRSMKSVRMAAFDHQNDAFDPLPHQHENGYLSYEALGSFAQINRPVNKQIQSYILELITAHDIQTLLDLYGGSANLSLPSLHVLKRLCLVEVSAASLRLAIRSCRNSNHVILKHGTVESELKTLIEQEFDMALVDPPRKGLNSTADALNRLRCRYMVYVSCNMASLKEDLLTLKKNYEVLSIKGFDMFPQTSHTEVICLLIKK